MCKKTKREPYLLTYYTQGTTGRRSAATLTSGVLVLWDTYIMLRFKVVAVCVCEREREREEEEEEEEGRRRRRERERDS